jgi:hypothetical protein
MGAPLVRPALGLRARSCALPKQLVGACRSRVAQWADLAVGDGGEAVVPRPQQRRPRAGQSIRWPCQLEPKICACRLARARWFS